MPDACLPMPKPFGVHVTRGVETHKVLQGCTIDARVDLAPPPGGSTASHCNYAVLHEFPWFPLFAGLPEAPAIKQALAEAIPPLVEEGGNMARRWWLVYELFFEPLPLKDWEPSSAVPFLPPERFFCVQGELSARHGINNNLLGVKSFCPFVEKFAGAKEASSEFQLELMEVLSPICMMTIKEFLQSAGIVDSSPIDHDKVDLLLEQLADAGFTMNDKEKLELVSVFGLAPTSLSNPLVAASIVEFAEWLRGGAKLASRLREHLLGVAPTDLRLHPPDDQFLDRMSRVISSIETRASQMIENELPPERKERFFVDAISRPWDRDSVIIDAPLCTSLQRGLLSEARYEHVCKTQVDGEPRRTTQNWVSSEKYDEMVGKEKVLHHLPPPPGMLEELLAGYFACVQRMMDDPDMDPIVCATIAKIAFNTLHPLVDGNGRVQRMLFQLVLFKFHFLPRMNVPVSVIMLQDRTGYEVLQQKHVDQFMAGITYEERSSESEGDTFHHLNEASDGVRALYQYQDFTFAVSSMTKLMQGTLPVIAAKAYFLQRFDWRVDELLKGDALLPPRAATKIAKVFQNDGGGLSARRLAKLLFLDGWGIGFRRIMRFLVVAQHPEEVFGLPRLREAWDAFWSRSQRRLWIMMSGQQMSSSSTNRVRWVGISLEKFALSEVALKRALLVSREGDSVVAVHYPKDMNKLFSMDLFPELAYDSLASINDIRNEVKARVDEVVERYKPPGVLFKTYVGQGVEYKPAYALCEDIKFAENRPYRVYIGYDDDVERRSFADYVVRNAPCDVILVKGDYAKEEGVTRWVGISARNFDISGSALIKAFAHSGEGDDVIAVHYPVNPFQEEGFSSVYERHYSSTTEDNIDLLMDNIHSRVIERANRVAEEYGKKGVTFRTWIGKETQEPHRQLVHDATTGRIANMKLPHTIYVGYNARQDRGRLVDPHKLYDVAEYIMRNAPCNVCIVKETQEEMARRVRRDGILSG